MANAGGGGAPAEAPDVDAIGHAALVVARLREVVDRADAAIAHVANDVALRPDDQQVAAARGAGDGVAVAALNAAVGDAEVAAFQLIGQLREIVAVLARERDQIREAVIQRGLLDDPDLNDNEPLGGIHFEVVIGDEPILQPESLFSLAVSVVVNNFSKFRQEVRFLPSEVLFEIYANMYRGEKYCQLGYEWCNLDVFHRMLMLKSKRVEIHQIYQTLVRTGTTISGTLIAVAKQRVDWLLSDPSWTVYELEVLYDFTLEMGVFLLEACSYNWAGEALMYCHCLLLKFPLRARWRQQKLFELNYWLLEYYTGNCMYAEAMKTCSLFDALVAHIEKLGGRNDQDNDKAVNLAQILIQSAVLWYQMGEYKHALRYAVRALRSLVNRATPMRTKVDVLRVSAKILICLRQFDAAVKLIRHAVYLALRYFEDGRRFTCVLFDYAFCLVNRDRVDHALNVYDIALRMRVEQFGPLSVRTSQALEDVAYALYVHEYGTGNFQQASELANRAVEINKKLLSKDHMLIASSQRMKALIMEEQALDLSDETQKAAMLAEALRLHKAALAHYQRRFGDENVHTAKNYGNIGRLYQSMGLYELSEEMHKKAIAIKARVLGEDDYETALSMGHLAALYTHDMDRQEEARDLYLKSIHIALKMFGESFTGLEYDYRGLLRVYGKLGDTEQADIYRMKLMDWEFARNRSLAEESTGTWAEIPTEPIETASDVARECLEALSATGFINENPLESSSMQKRFGGT
uniref:Amyloid protein-binding protein 2 n=1 Tax=Parascaris univalens TaxID=6257 RepID=A0A914ZZ16_PARUN